MISIRAYRSEDCAVVLEIFKRSVREIASRDYSAAQIAAWAPVAIDIKAFANRVTAKPTFIAEVGGVAGGFANIERDGHIDHLFVHPNSQRQGIGHALLVFLEERARSSGLRRLYAEVSITARPLFERYGFSVLAEQRVVIRGERLTNYRMEKRF